MKIEITGICERGDQGSKQNMRLLVLTNIPFFNGGNMGPLGLSVNFTDQPNF